MNVWYAAAIPLLLCFIPCIVMAVRGTLIDAVISMQMAGAIAVVALLVLEQGMQRQTFFDVSLALAVLTLPSSLLFARVYRRWL